jgi:hypothetical protein
MIAILFRLFTASLCLLTLVNTPQFGQQVQISEALFVLLSLSVLPDFLKKFKELWRFDGTDIGVGLVFLGALVANLRQDHFLGIAAIAYLVGIYFVSSRMLRLGVINYYIVYLGIRDLGILSIVFALLGPFVSFLDLRELKYLPFIGEVWRSKGFFPTPSLQASVLLLVFFVTTRWPIPNLKIFMGVILGSFFTLAKSLYPVLLAIVLMPFAKNRTWLLFFVVFISYMFLTHFIPLPSELSKRPEYVGSQVLVKNESFQILSTKYWDLKKRLFQCLPKSMVWGLGDDGFVKWQQKKYSREQDYLEPHCTYLRVLVEWGVLAGIGLFIVLLTSFASGSHEKYVTEEIGEKPIDEHEYVSNLMLGLTFFLFYGLIEMFNMDILHFRHWWLSIGILNGLKYVLPHSEEKIPNLG